MRRMRQFDDLSANALFLSWEGVNPRDGMSPKLPLVSGFLLGEVERGSCVDERKEKREERSFRNFERMSFNRVWIRRREKTHQSA